MTMQETKSPLIQDLCFKKVHEIKSSVSEVGCYVCGKGLHDGYRITAKTLPNGMALFCDVHYSLHINTHLRNPISKIDVLLVS